MSALKYRADIDGLRALAVLSVVLFHIHPMLVPNGFLGVDIFFVLSGYLITSIIYRDSLAGNFSYKEFYKRRIKRILPTFFAVIFFCIIVANLILVPGLDLRGFEHSTFASVLFAANLYFARGSGYFDVSSDEKPLQHIWSLSVEEQYYFIIPLLLIFIVNRKCLANRKYSILVAGSFLILLTSLTGLPDVGFNIGHVYYLPHLRFVEMFVGSLLAMLTIDGRLPLWTPKQKGLGALVSLLVLLFSFYAPEAIFQSPYFPGFSALIPCIATAVLIFCNTGVHGVSRFFSYKPVVFIGRISYSLYLWHWCILAFMRYTYEGSFGVEHMLIAVVLMTVLTLASYYLIEQPIRHADWSFAKSFIVAYFIPSAIVLGLYFFPIQTGNPDRVLYAGKIRFSDLPHETGILGDSTKTSTVLITGDSHTAQLGAFYETLAEREGWTADAVAVRSSPFLLNYPVIDNYKEATVRRNQWIMENLDKYKVVVISGYWGSDELRNTDNLLTLIDNTLSMLKEKNKAVYLINSLVAVDYPRYRSHNISEHGLGWMIPERDNYKGKSWDQQQANVERVAKHIKKYHPDVKWIDMSKEVPDDLYYQGQPIYSDKSHMTKLWARRLADLFTTANPLIDPKDLQ